MLARLKMSVARLITNSMNRCGAIAVGLMIGVSGIVPSAQAEIMVNYHLGNAPPSAAMDIMNAVNLAVDVFNEWSNYNEVVNVHYNTAVPTAQGNFDGTITFGADAQYHVPSTAWHEMLHVMGSGTYPGYQNFVSGELWTGAQGVGTSDYYYPGADLLADDHVHSVSGQNPDLLRQGVHIMGAMREDMGLLNGNFFGEPGDFDLSRAITIYDYGVLITNLHKAHPVPAAAFYNGDMNGDLLINFTDLVAFRSTFDEAHGAGAFQLSFGVPEPAAAILFAIGFIAVGSRRLDRRPGSAREQGGQ